MTGPFSMAETPTSGNDSDSTSFSSSMQIPSPPLIPSSSSPAPHPSHSTPSPGPSTSTPRRSANSSASATKLTLFEKTIIKNNKKVTKNINNLMSVFGQLVQQNYPNINVDNLLVISDSSDSD